MAISVAGRSTMVVRALFRVSTTNSTAATRLSAPPRPSIRSAFMPPLARISTSPSRLVRRELSSLRPVHSTIASACLVSKLPSDAMASSEGYYRKSLVTRKNGCMILIIGMCTTGRFANYLSPI